MNNKVFVIIDAPCNHENKKKNCLSLQSCNREIFNYLAKYLQLLAHSIRLAKLPELYGVRGDAVDSDTA